MQSPKNYITTLLLCFFLGTLGIHRFYAGKIISGLLMFITLGGLGLWYLGDLVTIAIMKFKDKQGHLILRKKAPVLAQEL